MTRAKRNGPSRRRKAQPAEIAESARPSVRMPFLPTAAVHAACLIVLAMIFGGAIVGHASNAADPLVYSDDSLQQVWPFLRAHDASLFVDDAIADYELAGMPVGYRIVFTAAAQVIDPRPFAEGLAYLLYALAVTGIAVSAGRLGGWPAAYAAAAFALSSFMLLERSAGGLPRAFAFPIVAGIAAALVTGRPLLLAALVPIGAAFYPMTSVVGGLSLAMLLFVLPARDRGKAGSWSLRRRIATTIGTAAIAGLVAAPNIAALSPYGPTIRSHDTERFPEVGPGGRYDPADRVPFESLAGSARRYATAAFFNGVSRGFSRGDSRDAFRAPSDEDSARPAWPAVQRWIDSAGKDGSRPRRRAAGIIVSWIAVCGTIVLIRHTSAARRFVLLAAAGAVGFAAASVVPPLLWLPPRYAFFTAPVIALVAVPAGVAGLGRLIPVGRNEPGARRRIAIPAWFDPRSVIVLVACAMIFFMFGGRGAPGAGLTVRIDPGVGIFRFVASLPENALVAGWPFGALDHVPYLSARRAFVTYETHQVFHEKYVEMMNARLASVSAAYYEEGGADGEDRRMLLRLRDVFGVTHMIVDRRHANAPPTYFEPHDSLAHTIFELADRSRILPASPPAGAVVYEEGPFVILDLALMPDSPDPVHSDGIDD